MGCDFAIFGSQPDQEIQNQCVDFVKALQDFRAPTLREVYEERKKYLQRNIQEDLSMSSEEEKMVSEALEALDIHIQRDPQKKLDSLELAWQSAIDESMEDSKGYSAYVTLEKLSQFKPGCDIVRHEPKGWLRLDDVAVQCEEWRRHESGFSMDMLHGVALTEPGGYYFYIVFDRSAPGGMLCSVELPGVVPYGGVDHAYNDYVLDGINEIEVRTDGKVHLWPGTETRFYYGKAMLYVVCKALKLRFIPNLLSFADAHMDVFDHLMDELGVTERLRDASLSDLPMVTAEAIKDAQQAFLELPKKQRMSPADFLGTLKP